MASSTRLMILLGAFVLLFCSTSIKGLPLEPIPTTTIIDNVQAEYVIDGVPADPRVLSAIMSFEEKFNAAIELINSLPKEGPISPSIDKKLLFYSYYKQAKFGKNPHDQPWAIQFEAKAKWEAWKKLGDMSKEEAMKLYVEEMYKEFSNLTDEEMKFAEPPVKDKIDVFLSLMKK